MSAQAITHPVDRAVFEAQINLPLLKLHYAVIREFAGKDDQGNHPQTCSRDNQDQMFGITLFIIGIIVTALAIWPTFDEIDWTEVEQKDEPEDP